MYCVVDNGIIASKHGKVRWFLRQILIYGRDAFLLLFYFLFI